MNHSSILARFILKLFWLQLPVRCSQVVTVISQATKEEVIKFTGCKESKVKIIPDFILNQFHPVPKQFNTQQPVILQVGTKPNKNISRLAEALKGIPCKLFIIGKPSDTDLRMLDSCTINYTWQANLSNNEVMQKYIESDMLAFVSTIEGFGMPIIEANTVERPVVTSNISSMPEVAGEAACLVDPYCVTSIREGILKIINNSAYREQLIINGRKNREKYNPITIADSYYQLYCEIYQGYKV